MGRFVFNFIIPIFARLLFLTKRYMRKKWTAYVRAFSVCTLAALFSSCQGELIEKQQTAHTVGFYAGDGLTRTIMQPDGLSAVWESGDNLALWAKSSAGTFELQNQIFKLHGADAQRGFFTSTLSSAMPEGSYTYMCCYPVPDAVNGTEVTFNVPSVQDGRASGGASVLLATPTQYHELTAIPKQDDHSTMKMEMNHMMHQFRFYVPEEDQLLGEEKIRRILMSFPKGVTGDVTLDLENIDAQAILTNAQKDITLELAQPVGVSDGNSYEFACLVMAPVQFDAGQTLQITKAYTEDKIAFFDPIDLKAKNCLPGHSTPVKLKIRELVEFAGIINVTLGANNLGENPKQITLTAPAGCNWGDGGSNVYVYNPGREIQVGETLTFKFETDLAAYKAFSGQKISVTYDSENALMSETLTMPAITGRGKTSMSMTVPYLLFEDFSCVHTEGESYGGKSYSSGDQRKQPGQSLDSYMSHTGWNAARFWIKPNAVRINTRHQETKVFISFASNHYGRLDTPKLSGLKSGKSVRLSVIFDAGGYKHKSSSVNLESPSIAVATHTTSGVLDGIPTGSSGLTSSYETSLADFGTTYDKVSIEDNCGEDSFNSTFTTRTATVYNANSENRICFYVDYTAASGTGNCEFNVYLDNIRVKIAK